MTYEKESTAGNRPPGRFGGVADTDCERLTEYGIGTMSVSARWRRTTHQRDLSGKEVCLYLAAERLSQSGRLSQLAQP